MITKYDSSLVPKALDHGSILGSNNVVSFSEPNNVCLFKSSRGKTDLLDDTICQCVTPSGRLHPEGIISPDIIFDQQGDSMDRREDGLWEE